MLTATVLESEGSLLDPGRFSSFSSLLNTMKLVLRFVNKLKSRIGSRGDQRRILAEEEIDKQAYIRLLKEDQMREYPEVIQFFGLEPRKISDIPVVVTQLNVFVDEK